MSDMSTKKLDGNQKEITKALMLMVKKGLLRRGWNKKGELVWQDTRVKPSKGIRWI